MNRDSMRAFILLLLIALATPVLTSASNPLPDWRQENMPPYPLFEPDWIVNPVIGAEDVHEENVLFVADPFLLHEGDDWYLFFEAFRFWANGSSFIALARSSDGVNWEYDRLVLDLDEIQLSFPCVFKWNDNYYMVPCCYPHPGVWLFKASPTEFPYQWNFVAEIASGELFADASLFFYDGLWWMFVANETYSCFLYYSTDLEDPAAWIEHPASPIVVNDRSRGRPGGRVVVLAGDRIFRPAMDSASTYGEFLRLFEVTELSTQFYMEEEIPESPILGPSGSGWNAARMHHWDPWRRDDQWLVAVDGHSGICWSIGIYTSPIETFVPAASAVPGLVLTCHPNPFNPATSFRFHIPAAGPARLCIYDVRGRLCCALFDRWMGEGWGEFRWDGCDGRGNALATGLYLAELSLGDQFVWMKVLLIK